MQKLSREAALLISKSKIKLIPWDVADHLRTPYEMALYLEATFEEFGHDGRALIGALGDIARAQGMTFVARRSGLGRESLYKALSGEGNPSFDTVLRVLDALGLRLTAVVQKPAPAHKRARSIRAARKGPARKGVKPRPARAAGIRLRKRPQDP